MYAEALHENERLKSRLQDSKKELDRVRSQLERVTQVGGKKLLKCSFQRVEITKTASFSPPEARQDIREVFSPGLREEGESCSVVSPRLWSVFPSSADGWTHVSTFYFLLFLAGKAGS